MCVSIEKKSCEGSLHNHFQFPTTPPIRSTSLSIHHIPLNNLRDSDLFQSHLRWCMACFRMKYDLTLSYTLHIRWHVANFFYFYFFFTTLLVLIERLALIHLLFLRMMIHANMKTRKYGCWWCRTKCWNVWRGEKEEIYVLWDLIESFTASSFSWHRHRPHGMQFPVARNKFSHMTLL
jgi:hypothetical protein